MKSITIKYIPSANLYRLYDTDKYMKDDNYGCGYLDSRFFLWSAKRRARRLLQKDLDVIITR